MITNIALSTKDYISLHDDDWRNGRHVVYQLHAHIVLVPKYRRNVMTERVSDEIRSAILEVCTRFDSTFDAFETDGDHAHLLITNAAKVALSRLVMSMKTLIAMRVRAKNWPEVREALWGGSTFGRPPSR
ncbi:IS200/IS605 family transposase [Acidithrix sp. C25]|uniref:IS200/IS605 family transposase n=1 Tax=Acidithrix sp. C25 TaxID=1671482 RepID=UPI00191BAB39|nr:IS200/IS605 family transposase [Acidithrix sp. C25]